MSGEGGKLMPEWRGEDSPRRSRLRPRRLLRLSGRMARNRRFLAGDNNARNVVCCFEDPAELDTATVGPHCWVSFIGGCCTCDTHASQSARAAYTHTQVHLEGFRFLRGAQNWISAFGEAHTRVILSAKKFCYAVFRVLSFGETRLL